MVLVVHMHLCPVVGIGGGDGKGGCGCEWNVRPTAHNRSLCPRSVRPPLPPLHGLTFGPMQFGVPSAASDAEVAAHGQRVPGQ